MKIRPRSLIILFLCCAFALHAQTVPVKDLKPTLILISIDGLRYDYLEKYKPPTLNYLAREGVRAKWLIPSYPTKTFPNHYTVATGLRPDTHGLIENNMYDAELNAEFRLSDRSAVQDPRWWGGEPIWVTAEKQGQTAAAFFFPGTETAIKGVRPTFWKDYDHDFSNVKRVDTVLSWFDLPKEKRPTVFTMYFADVDDAGHDFSPDAPETRKAVLKVDMALARLVDGLKDREIFEKVNLIIVSDHGMAAYKPGSAVILDDYFDVEDAERIFWVGEFTQIFPKPGKEDQIYESIRAKLPATAEIYRRSEFPARFKFGKNQRIAPIVVIPKEGAVITNRKRFEENEKRGALDKMRGAHGYDNTLESMRATFIARGPAFKRGAVVEPFENVEIYNLMTKILGLQPAPNEGDFDNIKHLLKSSKTHRAR